MRPQQIFSLEAVFFIVQELEFQLRHPSSFYWEEQKTQLSRDTKLPTFSMLSVLRDDLS
jgi:hypothetical protein